MEWHDPHYQECTIFPRRSAIKAKFKNRPHLLNLPSEIRNRIYDLVIPCTRIGLWPIQDPEAIVSAPDHPMEFPPILRTCRLVLQEAILMFYSKATLAIETNHDGQDDFGERQMYVQGLDNLYRHIPKPYMLQIRSVHIYTKAWYEVYQNAFQALFQWLVTNTSVESIWLSRRIMQQWRHIPRLIDLEGTKYDPNMHPARPRSIDVFAKRICPRLRVYRSGRSTMVDDDLVRPCLEIQSYSVESNDGNTRLCLDAEKSFFESDISNTEKAPWVRDNHSRVTDKRLPDPVMQDLREEQMLGLYQSIIINA